ncbi:glutamate--cysteine ligase [Exilibacterium tricleocarpae]|uniref:Glutamate--cysteine ligase n=1 Tax=Exilibacterium tricleocarpae TaxID=2591008 RepID=A0A545TZ75_9GAMM|nr:glutamate--cysteine ligase [Exilibacterium tricleocarpae]TQV82518.1 glutamate--cysteine ligase [Exilibacterium tricleocarpae]
MSLSQSLLAALGEPANTPLITGILRGIEKESLRITPAGHLACTPHPQQLGAALTHPQITTDFSEALLEFITPPSHRVEEVLAHLENIHRFTYQQLQNEYLWVSSMPCMLSNDDEVPVANYGTSNVGRMKTVYRYGLGHRYGRLMQTIAGIHYNFSLPTAFWAFLHTHENSSQELQAFKTERYFALIRNFRRYYWLLIYLFGAAPAVCRTFVSDRKHSLVPHGDDHHTLHTPYATSLRMGDLGYQSQAQEALVVCYNNLSSYLHTLCGAITQPHPDYEAIGLRNGAGEYQQLNTSLLQIENEFYSSIRPKRTAHSGETALGALHDRGVEYIEVRCIDLNPYEPLGIDAGQIHFLDTFLLYCLLKDSPEANNTEYRHILENQRRIVYRGREPGLTLLDSEGAEIGLKDWGMALLEELAPVAGLLDRATGSDHHATALGQQRGKVEDAQLTPSARVLRDMEEQGVTFFRLAMNQAERHSQALTATPLDQRTELRFRAMAATSLQEQAAVEAADTLSFEEYLQRFYAQYRYCNCNQP